MNDHMMVPRIIRFQPCLAHVSLIQVSNLDALGLNTSERFPHLSAIGRVKTSLPWSALREVSRPNEAV